MRQPFKQVDQEDNYGPSGDQTQTESPRCVTISDMMQQKPVQRNLFDLRLAECPADQDEEEKIVEEMPS